MLLKSCRYLVLQDSNRRVLTGVDLLIEGNRIAKIGKNLTSDGATIDCSDRVVMPGLINAHTHLGLGALRGADDDKELHEWLAILLDMENKLDDEEFFTGSLQGCQESLRFGTTTVIDQYQPIEPTITAVAKSGIRAHLHLSLPTLQQRQQGDQRSDIQKEIPALPGDALITLGLGPHAIYTCGEELLKEVAAFTAREQMTQVIHLAETRKEQYDCKRERGILPAEYLQKIGFLNERTILVHSVWLTKRELQLIADAGASCVHCPVSNMKLASGGVMPLQEMQERGINVGLGTDSVVSNNNLDMFEEMKVAALLHKQHYWDPTIADAQTVLDMATRNGAACLGLQSELGSIEEGKFADVITVAIPTHLQPIAPERVVSHLVYSANGNDVRDVIVDGKLRLADGKFTT